MRGAGRGGTFRRAHGLNLPHRIATALEAGLLFLAYQRDPRRQYTVHRGSAIFAIPGGVRPGGYVGQGLLEP
ncbi:MAG: deferrochelatase/peroxidase EfeB [Miltoncostaeaceae bacterium]|nr:deferrochelatase/peroxidase EfeB [Miltoncostaeaceae bacterium]